MTIDAVKGKKSNQIARRRVEDLRADQVKLMEKKSKYLLKAAGIFRQKWQVCGDQKNHSGNWYLSRMASYLLLSSIWAEFE